jgi:hypothetical protein
MRPPSASASFYRRTAKRHEAQEHLTSLFLLPSDVSSAATSGSLARRTGPTAARQQPRLKPGSQK